MSDEFENTNHRIADRMLPHIARWAEEHDHWGHAQAGEPDDVIFGDFICDTLHAAWCCGMDIDELVRLARWHFDEEMKGPAELTALRILPPRREQRR